MRPLASLSLDVDNQWSYMKTHGDTGWQAFPSYLDTLVDRVLAFLRQRGWRITFFVVGQDAALEKNREALARLSAEGHEIGNHSFHHEPWLHLYTPAQVDRELAQAEQHIEAATGVRPEGFRGPGFSVSATVLEALQRRGYLYDASTLPTFIGPLARAYYFRTAQLSEEERQQRAQLFGGLREGLRPVRPYRWRLPTGELLEIPVTTLPPLKLPFHLSYVLYLSTYSPALARGYFATAVATCRALGVQPSVLLHPLDFLGADDVQALSFFPGMSLEGARKRARVATYLDDLSRAFELVPMGAHARALRDGGPLPSRAPTPTPRTG